MKAKKNLEALWEFLNNEFDADEIENAAEECELDTAQFDSAVLDTLSEDSARALLFDLAYMAINGLFGGDFGTWNEVLYYNLQFDEETIDFLNY